MEKHIYLLLFFFSLAAISSAQMLESTHASPNTQNIKGQSGPTHVMGGPGHVLAGSEAPPVYAKFFSYPTFHTKPAAYTGNDETARLVNELRIQHWYFIFDQTGYVARYGALPSKIPGGYTAQAYSQYPPQSAFLSDAPQGNSPSPGTGQLIERGDRTITR